MDVITAICSAITCGLVYFFGRSVLFYLEERKEQVEKQNELLLSIRESVMEQTKIPSPPSEPAPLRRPRIKPPISI